MNRYGYVKMGSHLLFSWNLRFQLTLYLSALPEGSQAGQNVL